MSQTITASGGSAPRERVEQDRRLRLVGGDARADRVADRGQRGPPSPAALGPVARAAVERADAAPRRRRGRRPSTIDVRRPVLAGVRRVDVDGDQRRRPRHAPVLGHHRVEVAADREHDVGRVPERADLAARGPARAPRRGGPAARSRGPGRSSRPARRAAPPARAIAAPAPAWTAPPPDQISGRSAPAQRGCRGADRARIGDTGGAGAAERARPTGPTPRQLAADSPAAGTSASSRSAGTPT